MLVKSFLIGMRESEEFKAPRYASAAATYNGNLPSHDGKLLYIMAICLIPNTSNSSFVVTIYIQILLDYYNKYKSSLLTIAIVI
jgi:hypothetical protein